VRPRLSRWQHVSTPSAVGGPQSLRAQPARGARIPLVLVVLGGLLLFTLPMLIPSNPSGERLKIRRELRKF
jgi:hypothetical protein